MSREEYIVYLETELFKSRASEAELIKFITKILKYYECGAEIDREAESLIKKYGEWDKRRLIAPMEVKQWVNEHTRNNLKTRIS